jgi:hypothetical protein
VLIILALWFKRFVDGRYLDIHKETLVLLSVLTLIFLIIAGILLNREYNNYPNYLYERYGLTLSQLEFMSFVAALELLTFLTIFTYGLKTKVGKIGRTPVLKRQAKESGTERASFFLAIIGLVSMIIFSIRPFFNWPVMLSEAQGGFERKVGVHYKYIKSLAIHVPKDETIIHPPQGNKWPAIGNQPVIRYFLFPRRLVSGALMENQEFAESMNTAYFTEMDVDIDLTHWPEINAKNKFVIFDEKTEIYYQKMDVYFEEGEIVIYKINF